MPLEKTYHDLCDEAREEVGEINVKELHDALNSDAPPLLIDVREPDETSLGTIPDAVVMPRGVLERDIARAFGGRVGDEDLERPIVVYCAGGSRSLLAARTLKEMGFSRSASLRGGYRAWIVASC